MAWEFDGYDKMVHSWIERESARHLPRQATVLRSEGNTVVVRFGGPDAGETVLPTTVTGLPPGSVGLVYPVAGGKGLFVATGVSAPQTKASPAPGGADIQLSSPGTEHAIDQMLSFGGLIPDAVYDVSWTVMFRFDSGGSGRFRTTARVVGSTTETPAYLYTAPMSLQEAVTVPGGTQIKPNTNGVITVTPAAIWESGTVSINGASIVATVSPN